jgi:hypothetical protein
LEHDQPSAPARARNTATPVRLCDPDAVTKALLAAGIAALLLAGAASAAFVIPASVVAQDRFLISQIGGPSDFFRLPTWAPPRYIESNSGVGTTYVDVVLADKRALAKKGTDPLKHSLEFTSELVDGSIGHCRATKPTPGIVVPTTGSPVWRCLHGKSGRVVRVSAYGPGLSRAMLLRVVDSAKPA